MIKKINIPLLLIYLLAGCVNDNQDCGTDGDVLNVSQKVWAENVLRVDISYELNDSIGSFVEYWDAENINNKQKANGQGPLQNKVTLINLKPNHNYAYKIILEDSCKSSSETFEFQTKDLPELLSKIELVENKNNEFEGYTLFHQSGQIDSHYLVITDSDGDVVWYQYINDSSGPFYWTKNNTILTLLGEEKMIEIDLFGNVLFELALGEKGFDKKIHHEIRHINGNQILGITREIMVLSQAERLKYGLDTLKSDGIILLDKEGNKLWSWSLLEVESPLIDEFDTIQIKDWGHANSVSPDLAGNYLISFRNFSQVWNIDSSTGQVIWKLGRDGDFDLDEDAIFTQQHAAHINSRGELMLFDNGGKNLISRALSFQLNEDEMSSSNIIDIKLPADLFTPKRGNSSLINSNGQILLCSTFTNYNIVTDSLGNIIWKMYVPVATYRVEYIEALSE